MTIGCAEKPAARSSNIRIVSLNPCTDAILAEIAPDKLVAVSHYSHDPAASSIDMATAHRWRATSGTVEEIVALKPDLVVASTFLPPATAQALERMDLPVARVGIAATVEESIAQIRELAAQVDERAAGEALVARIEDALSAAVSEGEPIEALVWQAGGIVPGAGTLIADLLRRTGFTNAAAARGLGQADRLPLEAVLAEPPALILAAGSPFAEDDRALFHPALEALEATKRARLDPTLLYCGGPTIIRAAERLREIRDELSPLPPAGGAARLGRDSDLVAAGWAWRAPGPPPAPPVSGRGDK